MNNSLNSLARFNHNPNLVLPHTIGLMDRQPIIANPFNDEFEGYDLDSKWTIDTTGMTGYSINTLMPSFIWGDFPYSAAGTTNVLSLQQSISDGTGLFSITIKATVPSYEAYQTMQIRAFDDDETDGVRSGWIRDTNGDCYGSVGYLTSSSWTYDTSIFVKNYSFQVYVHLQRNASNIWKGWVTFSGANIWFEIGQVTKSVTIDHIDIRLGMGTTAGQSAFTGGYAGIDWVRKDFISL